MRRRDWCESLVIFCLTAAVLYAPPPSHVPPSLVDILTTNPPPDPRRYLPNAGSQLSWYLGRGCRGMTLGRSTSDLGSLIKCNRSRDKYSEARTVLGSGGLLLVGAYACLQVVGVGTACSVMGFPSYDHRSLPPPPCWGTDTCILSGPCSPKGDIRLPTGMSTD